MVLSAPPRSADWNYDSFFDHAIPIKSDNVEVLDYNEKNAKVVCAYTQGVDLELAPSWLPKRASHWIP